MSGFPILHKQIEKKKKKQRKERETRKSTTRITIPFDLPRGPVATEDRASSILIFVENIKKKKSVRGSEDFERLCVIGAKGRACIVFSM